jgi:CRP-like cAMP-binding protein
MLTPRDFQKQFKRLLLTPVSGLSLEEKVASVRAFIRELDAHKSPEEDPADVSPSLEIVPFDPDRRPIDEVVQPGHGASEHAGYICTTATDAQPDEIWILYRLRDCFSHTEPFDRPLGLRVTVSLLPHPSEYHPPCPLPNLRNIPIPPRVISHDAYPRPALEESSWNDFHRTAYVFGFVPESLLPRRPGNRGAYEWSQMDPGFRARTPDGQDPFTFAHLFHQRVRISLTLEAEGSKPATDSIDVEVFDTGRFGSLYARLLDRLVTPDTVRQAERLNLPDLHAGYHPWFPVLTIGMDKALLYLRAIHQDLGPQRRNLPDPAWLLRVGLYLELLTCLGIFEAVREEYPDLLSPAERRAFEYSPAYVPVRKHIDPAAWRKVWALRDIVPKGSDLLALGPVGFGNLLRKQKATLAFLHAHHEDLKNAIKLAGPNTDNAQETWHRVFRDAERAVLKNSLAAFPELSWLDHRTREFVLWHQKGLFGGYSLPGVLAGAFGDQDGLFPSACRQYRRSMNEVAIWARERGLMDHTGDDCIPISASLLEATMRGDSQLLDVLQRRDGYGDDMDLDEEAPVSQRPLPGEIDALIRRIPVLKPLTDREIHRLAEKARRVTYGPLDRIVLQGEKGSSLFLVASGDVEVVVRQADGRDVAVATMEPGAIFGETALLTGGERTATVRAVGEATLYEISKEALQPIIESRPQLVVELALLMAERTNERRERFSMLPPEPTTDGLATRIRRFFLG